MSLAYGIPVLLEALDCVVSRNNDCTKGQVVSLQSGAFQLDFVRVTLPQLRAARGALLLRASAQIL